MGEALPQRITRICEIMPKVELHAHLNGSISERILRKLRQSCFPSEGEGSTSNGVQHNGQLNNTILNLDGKRNLTECWEAFKTIHEFVRTPALLYAATCEVIQTFSRDRVIYLELRTTPKKAHDISSKEEYIQTVIRAIRDCKADKKLPITVKLLLSIDRRGGETEGAENVTLTRKYMTLHPDVVVGLDVSGDPNYGKEPWLMFLMQSARSHGIPMSCHLSEIINPEETEKFMEFKPERIAHGQYLHPTTEGNERLWNFAKILKIPIEVCVTSNLISGVCRSIEEHYVRHVHEDGIPFVIGTDDPGVFNTSLSNEYKKCASLIGLNEDQLKTLNLASISYSFASRDEKIRIENEIMKWWKDFQDDTVN